MTYEFRIETGKVREFRRATRCGDLPVAELDETSIPPTYLFTSGTFWPPSGKAATPSEGIGLDLSRVLHAEEEFVFHGPPPVPGTALEVSTRVEPPYEKDGSRGGRLRFVEIVAEYRDSAGTLRAEQKTTLVETQHAPTDAT